MKATIDVPDDLYRKVKARSALEGRALREVAVELFERYLEQPEAIEPTPPPARRLLDDGRPAPSWFGLARPHMRDVEDHGMQAIRASIARGWSEETARGEAALRRRGRR